MSLELKNISKSFGNVTVLKNINLKINKGEFFVLLGPTGSGKSTLLRIIAGLEEPDTGEIVLNGKVINELDPSKRNIAMVFQNYALYPHMTAFNNIAFPLRMRGVNKTVINEKINEIAKLLNITHLLNKYPYQLSGGEQQRVALARALVRNPEIFLLDEPLSNLDAKLRVKLRFELRKLLHDQLGITTVYVTHDQVEAMTMADRIAVINKGEISQIDSPLELYNNPKNTFVASFIGVPSMNFLPAYISAGTITFGNYTIRFHDKIDIMNRGIIIGIRPQHIKIDEGGVKAKVIGEERLGSGYIIHAILGGFEITIYSEKEFIYLEGGDIPIKFSGTLYLFNQENEELIGKINKYELFETSKTQFL
jgi:multiple sugar transport system ATP-binding protein